MTIVEFDYDETYRYKVELESEKVFRQHKAAGAWEETISLNGFKYANTEPCKLWMSKFNSALSKKKDWAELF